MPIISASSGSDERAALLPAELLPLFDAAFIRSCDLYEEYVFRLAQGVFLRSGLAAACTTAATTHQALERAGLDSRAAHVPVDWLCRVLASRSVLRVDDAYGETRYTLRESHAETDPEPVRLEQERHDHRALPAYAMAALAAEQYPAVLRGETSGERALFGMERMAAWAGYFANDNVLYAISNTLGAMACVAELRRHGGAVLEVGGGLGSGAVALCDGLAANGVADVVSAYRFTELSFPFLRRAQRSLTSDYPDIPFAFARLDMNRPFAEAGVEPGEYTLVHAVNALHVAHDLAFTLGQIREALRPGGALVIAESVRPFHGQPVYTEFTFNLLESFQRPLLVPEWRPNGGFLTPEQWTAALDANGFREVRLVPDIVALREAYPAFVVAAIVARRA